MAPSYAFVRSPGLTRMLISPVMTAETLVVLCTCPDEGVAADLAHQIVAEGLAACVNRFGGLTSVYKWEGEMREGTEIQLVIKTSAAALEPLIERLQTLHPYELPEIIAVPISAGHGPYLDWIRTVTS